MRGPALFIAQFLEDTPPFDTLPAIAAWAATQGFTALQIPTWDRRVFDLDKAAMSKIYCQDFVGALRTQGLEVAELASYLQGQVMGIHPAYAELFQPFYPQHLNDRQRVAWAQEQLKKTIQASAYMGTNNISVLSGGLAWHLMYPWPQRSPGLIDEAFAEMARRWRPVLDDAAEHGITFGYELHPGSDLFDGATYLRFLELVDDHPAACLTYDPSHFLLQQMDYVGFIRRFGQRIKAFHVKDAEFLPNELNGVYGGYLDWKQRAGRFRSPGDGQVDFKRVFSALMEVNFSGWAILEWECCFKRKEDGGPEGAQFIKNHLFQQTTQAFDDFAKSATDQSLNRRVLGLGNS